MYIICTNIWFTCSCFYCKRSMRISVSIPSGKLRYLAVQMGPPGSRCCNSISGRRAEGSSGCSWSSAGARCVALALLLRALWLRWAAWVSQKRCQPCLGKLASSHQLGYVYRSCSRKGSCYVAMPWNTDYSKKCLLPSFSFLSTS